MDISRRDFLKVGSIAAGSLLLPATASAATSAATFPLHKRVSEGASICPYCSVGCGVIVATDAQGRIVNTEGDPDNIHNRGTLDPKGVSVTQLNTDPKRATKVLYRAPNGDKWEEKSWDWAIGEIAKRVKQTRDATFKEKEGDVTVNRTEGIAWVGGASNTNEDCYLGAKFSRALGVAYLEHQARI